MERIFCGTKKIIALIVIILILGVVVAPISKAAYTSHMKVGEKYIYKGFVMIIYRDKNAAKKSNIFKTKGGLGKGTEITIQEIDGDILKIGDSKYIKLSFLNNSTKFKRVETIGKQEEQKNPQSQDIKVTGIQLNKQEETIYLNNGNTYKIQATVSPTNATNKKIIWSSSNTNVATVDQNGLVTAKKTGEVQITAKTEDGSKTAICKIKVTKIEMSETNITLSIGETKTLQVISTLNNNKRTVQWKSDNTGIATVDSNGKVTAKANGSTTIRATTTEGIEVVCTVTVKKVAVTEIKLTKSSIKIGLNKSATLGTTITPDNATNKNVTWTSSNTNVATVDSNGKVTGKKLGTATITVKTNDGGKTAKCTVTVIQPVTGVTLNKTSLTMYIDETTTLTATVAPKNAENKNVTWSSNNTDVATVNSSGKVTAKAKGKATITVKTNDGGKTATCTVEVRRKFVDVAKDVKKQIATGGVNYSLTSFSDFSKSTPITTKKVDCSSYVSWVIYNYGVINNIDEYKNNFKASKNTTAMYDWLNSSGAAQKIGTLQSAENNGTLKPGDIIIKRGTHVEIYAGKSAEGKLLMHNCGNNTSVDRAEAAPGASVYNKSGYTIFRLIK